MTDISVLVPPKTSVPTPQRMAARGLVAVPPASLADDTVKVTLPSYSGDYGWPCRWVRQGNTLPAIGAECFVDWDETGAGVVTWWTGTFAQLATEAEAVALDARLDALETVPKARVFNSANISLATSGTLTVLTFDSERFDTGGLHSTSSNTSRLTAPTAGAYSIGANVSFDANATRVRQVAIRLNGTTFIESDIRASAGAVSPTQISVPTLYQLAAADYVELLAMQSSGGALNVIAGAAVSPEFWMYRVSG